VQWKVGLIIFTLSLSLFSGELEERLSSLEDQMKEVGGKTPEGTFGASFASETFERGWVGIGFSGSVLYWHAKVGGSEYAYSLARSSLGFPLDGEEKNQNFGWDWGYRLGLGMHLPIVRWDIVGNYTHFGAVDKISHGKDLFVNLKGSHFLPSDHVKSHYKIDYDAVDIALHFSSFLSRFFGMETFWGARNTWIDQKQAAHYSNDHVKDHCDFHGIGPRVGGSLKWHLLYGASFFADVAGSLLYGNFEVKHSENQIKLKGSSHLFSANLNFLFGLGWDIYENWYHFGISIGYEAEYYWRQNRMIEVEGMPRLQIFRSVDDLTFYGITLRALIEF
jgi:hypothetical protein